MMFAHLFEVEIMAGEDLFNGVGLPFGIRSLMVR